MGNVSVEKFADNFLKAWNAQDVDAVAACYSENLTYLDPNTRGAITDQDSFKRYLRKLFAAWDMIWSTREGFPLKEVDGYAYLWHAVIRKTNGEGQVEIDGMDLVVMDGDRILRNEVYFDRALLAPLMGM